MRKMMKHDSLLIYFILSLISMDILFRVLTLEKPFTFSMVLSIVFLLLLGFLFYLITSFFRGTINMLLAHFLLFVTSLIYSSQFINYKISRNFYSIYSAGNGAQVLDFWKDIAGHTIKQSLWLILFFLPVILLSFLRKRVLSFDKIDRLNRIPLILCIGLSYTSAIIIIFIGGKDQHSAYDLYFKNSYPILSAERLGLLTTMRLDVQRLLLNWSPVNEVPVLSQPELTEKTLPAGTNNGESLSLIEREEMGIKYNMMPIDFPKLIANENSQELKNIHEYFNHVQPTAKNSFTGKFKGYNLIYVTAESFSSYAVDKDLTPTLYKMVHEGYHFTNFYNPLWGVSTSDGEYAAVTSLIPKIGVWSFRESAGNSLPLVLGNQLKKLNYKTMAYHNHTYSYYRRDLSHPNMGYVYKGLGNGLNIKKTWPESDLEMMEETIPEYIQHQPFHTYYMTVSGHMQYSFTGNYIAWKNKKYVEHLLFSEQGKAYLATQIELDRALQYLLSQLEAEGIAEKTLIVVSPDHFPYGLEDQTIDDLAGHPIEKNFGLYKSTFIIYAKGMERITVDKPVSSLDILPTISNLLGLEYDSRLLMGKDIFSDSEPLVILMNKSFITDKGRYNSITKEFTGNEHAEVDKDYVKTISDTIQGKFYYSAKILENDYYRKVFGD